jgi:hypothetical protein
VPFSLALPFDSSYVVFLSFLNVEKQRTDAREIQIPCRATIFCLTLTFEKYDMRTSRIVKMTTVIEPIKMALSVFRWTVFLCAVAGLLLGSLSGARAATSVTLAWDPSSSSEVVGYRVHYGTSSTSLDQSLEVGNNLGATIQNLVDGQIYFFVVTDYTAAGIESAPSNMVVFNNATGTPPGNSTPPGNGTPTVTNPSPNGAPASVGILWQNTSTGSIGLWLMQGTNITATQFLGQFDPSWRIVGIGDFSGNGNNDILWYNAQLSLIGIWTMNGSTRTASYILSGGSPDWDVVAVADFDHTGLSDILWRQKSSGDVYLWKCVAPVSFSPIFIASVDPSWQISGVADVEGSGSPDLIWRNTSTGGLAIWQLVNDQPGRQVFLGDFSLDFVIAGFGDFNGDGKADVLWRNQNTGDVYVWLMNGFSAAGEWYAGPTDPVWRIVGTPALVAGGTNDILWINTSDGSVAAWLGSPSGFTKSAPFSSVSAGWLPMPALK